MRAPAREGSRGSGEQSQTRQREARRSLLREHRQQQAGIDGTGQGYGVVPPSPSATRACTGTTRLTRQRRGGQAEEGRRLLGRLRDCCISSKVVRVDDVDQTELKADVASLQATKKKTATVWKRDRRSRAEEVFAETTGVRARDYPSSLTLPPLPPLFPFLDFSSPSDCFFSIGFFDSLGEEKATWHATWHRPPVQPATQVDPAPVLVPGPHRPLPCGAGLSLTLAVAAGCPLLLSPLAHAAAPVLIPPLNRSRGPPLFAFCCHRRQGFALAARSPAHGSDCCTSLHGLWRRGR